MHVVMPKQGPDGLWRMMYRPLEPRGELLSLCLNEEETADGEAVLVPCKGHPTSAEARSCRGAKAWIKRISLEGALVAESLREQPKVVGA